MSINTFKKVGYQLLPKSIIDSKKKGFSMPLSLIMRNDLKNKITLFVKKKFKNSWVY